MNDPNSGVAWDSGEVSSARNWAWSGTLTDVTNYYAYVRIGSSAGWSGWSAPGHWFRTDSSQSGSENVLLLGNSYADDDGPFLGLGVTYMAAMWMCKYDRTNFRGDLAFLQQKGFNYMRILSEVPAADAQDYWYNRAILPNNIVCQHGTPANAWPDYDQQFRDTIDIAYDEYGIRTEITVFGGAGESMPNYSTRQAHCQRIINLIAGREHKVILVEVANEGWQTGWSGEQGRLDLRSIGQYLADRTSIPIALTAMCTSEATQGDLVNLYSGSAADVTTEHFERYINGPEGHWFPVRDCWRVVDVPGLPPASSNEPIGPGSSVNTEDDPIHLASAAAFAWTANLNSYVFHSSAGVRRDVTFQSMAGINNMGYLRQILPPDLSSWVRNDGKESTAPFTAYCNGQANKYWTDVGGATSGCHRNIGGRKGNEFVCYPQGILNGGLILEARQQVTFTVYNPLTGAVVVETTIKNPGQQLNLPKGPEAYIIKGVLGAADIAAPAAPSAFTAISNGTTNDLSWTNPADADFAGTIIRYRTDTYPTGPTDGTLVCNRTASPGSNDSFPHTGVNPASPYYYAAYAYDEVPNYSLAALASTVPSTIPVWLNEIFDNYNNGNLGNQGAWLTVGASSAQAQSAYAKGGTGKSALMDTVPSGQSVANQITFSDKTSGYCYLSFDIAQDATATLGQVLGYVTIYGSDSATEITKLHIQKSRMFVEYGSGSLTTLSAAVANTTWYNVRFGFNVDTRKFDLWLDGAPKGTNYSWEGTATRISRIVISSDRNPSADPQKIYIDNVKLEPKLTISSVTDDGSWSPSLDKLHFSIAPVAGALQYHYAVGTTSGGTQVRGWTNCGSSTDYTATGLSLIQTTTTYYVSAQASMYGNFGPTASANGIKIAPGIGTILAAKGLANGAPTDVKALRGKIVTATFPGCFYIQEPGGLHGLKVISTASVAPSDEVDVAGVMAGAGSERFMDSSGNGVIRTTPGPGVPPAVIVGGASVGGVELNAYTPGVIGATGPNNIGLYMTVIGQVTQRDTGDAYFYVDDGSGKLDGTQTGGIDNVGIRISADPTDYPADSYVMVTGVSSCFDSGGLRPLLLPSRITLLRP